LTNEEVLSKALSSIDAKSNLSIASLSPSPTSSLKDKESNQGNLTTSNIARQLSMVSTPNKHSITRPQATHSGLSPNKDFNQTDNSPSKSTLKNPLPKNGPIRATPITTKRAQFVKKQFGLRDETNVRVSNAKQNDLESKVDDTDDTMTNLRKSFAGIFGEL
jgi:hypothetical protein